MRASQYLPVCRGEPLHGWKCSLGARKIKSGDTKAGGIPGATIRMINQKTSLPLALPGATFLIQGKAAKLCGPATRNPGIRWPGGTYSSHTYRATKPHTWPQPDKYQGQAALVRKGK